MLLLQEIPEAVDAALVADVEGSKLYRCLAAVCSEDFRSLELRIGI